jgi:2-hydroxychromene-2-carboxylate isomerase
MMRGAELETSTLTVALDVRHPLAFLALSPAIAFGREREIAINWLPFAGEPLRAPSEVAVGDDRGTRHRRHRARMIAREIAVYAEAQGLAVVEPYRSGSAEAVDLGWLWMRSRAPQRLEPFLEEAFRRYWALELDAADREAVAKTIGSVGEDAAGFLEWAGSDGPAALDLVASALAEAGVHSAPAYLACGQVFLGRQHLPMIRWLLDGQKTPVPI